MAGPDRAGWTVAAGRTTVQCAPPSMVRTTPVLLPGNGLAVTAGAAMAQPTEAETMVSLVSDGAAGTGDAVSTGVAVGRGVAAALGLPGRQPAVTSARDSATTPGRVISHTQMQRTQEPTGYVGGLRQGRVSAWAA